jgi:rhodanese-related sulfurtransferase
MDMIVFFLKCLYPLGFFIRWGKIGSMRKQVIIAFVIGVLAGFSTSIGRVAAQQPPTSAISVDAVAQQLQEKQNLVLVDVRDSQAFEQVRIPGSLNIPLFAVKTKAFLKSKPLVLVDEGSHPRQLENACKQLQQAGFDARFLFGGLNAWQAWSANVHLLPLQGDVFAQKALNTMPPRALFAEREGKYWLLIDVSANPLPRGEEHPPGPPQGGNVHSQSPSTGRRTGLPTSDAGEAPALPGALPGGGLFSQTLSVPFDRDHPELFLPDLEHAVANAAVRSERFLVVIYNQHGEDYETIERVLQHTEVPPVFFLEGGFNAYKQFAAQQTQITQGLQQKLSTTCCPSCPR